MRADTSHVIPVETAGTLDGLFRERVRRTPDHVAYRYFDEAKGAWESHTWAAMARHVARWRAALEREGLAPGDRVGIMLRNSPEWVMCDIAALSLGLVVVPLYTQDRADNIAYIVNHAGCKVLLFESRAQWDALAEARAELGGLVRLVSVKPVSDGSEPRLTSIAAWLPAEGAADAVHASDGQVLATIVYTSGTTGRPKGVMLSHHNILTNAYACLTGVMATGPDDVFMSFLPLSHTFERTCGYYLTMMAGSTTAYARSIPQLSEDLQAVRPTVLVSVPRIYERVWSAIRAKLDEGPPLRKKLFLAAVDVGYARFEHAQGRGPRKSSFLLWPLLRKLVADKVLARLGGRLEVALSGGAALSPEIARIFIGLGLPVVQGYGMTESAPVACANRIHDNVPASVGCPIPGVEVRLGANDALMIRGPNVMLGYWQDPEATRQILSDDGWLNSGDVARIDAGGHVYITGRLKEIIVMSNGEKVPPVDMEVAISRDPLFDQIMLMGEGRPFLSAIAVLNADHWSRAASAAGLPQDIPLTDQKAQRLVLARIAAQLKAFPGYAQVRRVLCTLEPWTIDNGFLTPTMKLKRASVLQRFGGDFDALYRGHV